MKITAKITILIVSIMLAISGVMIFAKTIVEPPMALKQKNQYSMNLAECLASLATAESEAKENSVFIITADRIIFFESEGKLTKADADNSIDDLLGRYTPLFLKHSFDKFQKSIWHDGDHNYMLNVIGFLKSIKHSDGTQALANSTLDSLNTVEKIINNYHQARSLSKRTSYSGVSNAQNVINQARKYATDAWLSHCNELLNALNSVKSKLAQSHYNYISAQVEKLSQYRYYGQEYYENTLIPQVDADVTEYDNKALALYGSKRDVNSLWNKARSYYNDALSYYEH